MTPLFPWHCEKLIFARNFESRFLCNMLVSSSSKNSNTTVFTMNLDADVFMLFTYWFAYLFRVSYFTAGYTTYIHYINKLFDA